MSQIQALLYLSELNSSHGRTEMSSAGPRLVDSSAAEVELDAVVDNRCVVDRFKMETQKRHAHHCCHSLAEIIEFRKFIIFLNK
jgi:hypothetical protein